MTAPLVTRTVLRVEEVIDLAAAAWDRNRYCRLPRRTVDIKDGDRTRRPFARHWRAGEIAAGVRLRKQPGEHIGDNTYRQGKQAPLVTGSW